MWLFKSSEGFSVLEKNTVMFSYGNAAHPVRCDSRLADSNGSLAHFLNLNLLGWVWQPAADNSGSFGELQIKK